MLRRIAEDADPEVRLTAAAFLLAIDEPFALGVLGRIQDSALGLSSFTAEMTICEWKKGNLWGSICLEGSSRRSASDNFQKLSRSHHLRIEPA